MKFLLLLFSLFFFEVSAKKLVIAYSESLASYDILEKNDFSTKLFAHFLFDPLVRKNSKGVLVGRLAKSWHYESDTLLKITLRQDVSFHSGNSFTSKDVVWTFKRIKQSIDFKGLFSSIKQVKALDDYHILIETTLPDPLLLASLSSFFPMDSLFYTGLLLNGRNKADISKQKLTFAARNVSGTGPFTVGSYKDKRLEFKRNPSYWDTESKGNLDIFSLVTIGNPSTRVSALLSNEVDLILQVPFLDFDRINRRKDLKIVTFQGDRPIFFMLNQQRNKHLKNVKVRQAINYVINNELIVNKVLRNFAVPASQLSPPNYLGHNDSLLIKYDLKKAKALMSEAGYSKGFRLDLAIPNGQFINDVKVGQSIAVMLAKININVVMNILPKAQYWPLVDKCDSDMLMMSWYSDSEDSVILFKHLIMPKNNSLSLGDYNCSGYQSSELLDLYLESSHLLDITKRAEILGEIEKIVYDEALIVPIYWRELSWAGQSFIDIKSIVNANQILYLSDLVF